MSLQNEGRSNVGKRQSVEEVLWEYGFYVNCQVSVRIVKPPTTQADTPGAEVDTVGAVSDADTIKAIVKRFKLVLYLASLVRGKGTRLSLADLRALMEDEYLRGYLLGRVTSLGLHSPALDAQVD